MILLMEFLCSFILVFVEQNPPPSAWHLTWKMFNEKKIIHGFFTFLSHRSEVPNCFLAVECSLICILWWMCLKLNCTPLSLYYHSTVWTYLVFLLLLFFTCWTLLLFLNSLVMIQKHKNIVLWHFIFKHFLTFHSVYAAG